MFSDILPMLHRPLCNAEISLKKQCQGGHKISATKEAPNFLFNPTKEIMVEFAAAKRDEELNKQMLLENPFTEKQIFEYDLILKDIKKVTATVKPKTILELGSGYCYVAYKLAADFPDSQIIASDIYFAKVKQLGPEPKNLNKIISSMDALPFRNNSIDIIIVTSALHHASRLNAVFSECYRILTRGGKFLIFDEITTSYLEPNKKTNANATSKGYNDQLYKFSDYKLAAEKTNFNFNLKFPLILDYVIKNMPPNQKQIKPAKRLIAKAIQAAPPAQFLIKKLYPVLVSLVILPSLFVCTKE